MKKAWQAVNWRAAWRAFQVEMFCLGCIFSFCVVFAKAQWWLGITWAVVLGAMFYLLYKIQIHPRMQAGEPEGKSVAEPEGKSVVVSPAPSRRRSDESVSSDVVSALCNLGYSRKEAWAALPANPMVWEFDAVLRDALGSLAPRVHA